MKKYLIISLILLFSLTGCGNQEKNNQNENNSENYIAYRTATNSSFTNDTKNEIDPQEEAAKQKKKNNIEEELSSFSTKIYTPDDDSRQKNITLTCSYLNETIVKSGETFSFCNTVGKATPERRVSKSRYF